MIGIIVIIVGFIVLHLFDKWLIEKGVQNPLVYSIVCGGFCIAGIIVRFALSGVYSDFVAKLDFVDFIFGSAQSVGDVICRYLIFISAFMCMPYIPDITWEDRYTEYLNISKWRGKTPTGMDDTKYTYEYKGRNPCIDPNGVSEQAKTIFDKVGEGWEKYYGDKDKLEGLYSRDVKEFGAVPGLAIKLMFVLGIFAFLFLAVAQGGSAPTDFFSTMLGALILLVPTCLIEFGIRKLINKMLLKQAEKELNK